MSRNLIKAFSGCRSVFFFVQFHFDEFVNSSLKIDQFGESDLK